MPAPLKLRPYGTLQTFIIIIIICVNCCQAFVVDILTVNCKLQHENIVTAINKHMQIILHHVHL